MELNATERSVLRRATILILAGGAVRLVCGPGEGSVGWRPPSPERHPGREVQVSRDDEPEGGVEAGGTGAIGSGHVSRPEAPAGATGLARHRDRVREATRKAERAARPLAPGERVPLNSAPPEELQRLVGVGPVLAERIIAERRRRGGFRRVEELLEVSGIGPKTLARIRHHIILR